MRSGGQAVRDPGNLSKTSCNKPFWAREEARFHGTWEDQEGRTWRRKERCATWKRREVPMGRALPSAGCTPPITHFPGSVNVQGDTWAATSKCEMTASGQSVCRTCHDPGETPSSPARTSPPSVPAVDSHAAADGGSSDAGASPLGRPEEKEMPFGGEAAEALRGKPALDSQLEHWAIMAHGMAEGVSAGGV